MNINNIILYYNDTQLHAYCVFLVDCSSRIYNKIYIIIKGHMNCFIGFYIYIYIYIYNFVVRTPILFISFQISKIVKMTTFAPSW
jgi:hypothetical protein